MQSVFLLMEINSGDLWGGGFAFCAFRERRTLAACQGAGNAARVLRKTKEGERTGGLVSAPLVPPQKIRRTDHGVTTGRAGRRPAPEPDRLSWFFSLLCDCVCVGSRFQIGVLARAEPRQAVELTSPSRAPALPRASCRSPTPPYPHPTPGP
ncbi:hypothetical protein SKAU_G00179380 [Synaphobranchus kaupii]|uniref:Uncharacterized protein n=1 Tax=Synaphobranchus kaupii TaxID=118154 RepID=A0A9Q1J160_SYNKA|nr:hypothetical protein SKAU_G00179380 [Synaphobranchus kaupii]